MASIGKYKILSYTAVGGLGTAAATNKWQRLAGRRVGEPLAAGNPPRGNSGVMRRIGASRNAIGTKPLWTSFERSEET